MSTLYLLLPQSSTLPNLVDMVCTLLAGGHPIEANQVQPVVYSEEALDANHLPQLTHEWPKWLTGLHQNLPTLSSAIGITTNLTKSPISGVPEWCRPHVMAYEALAHQLQINIQANDSVMVLFNDISQLPWAYAVKAYFEAFTKHVAGVWQMPPQALADDGCVSAAYEPQLTALQQILPMVCTGLRSDATTHAGFTLVETAAALLHAFKEKQYPLMCVSQRGRLQYYSPQHIPFTDAMHAMQRVVLWQVVADQQNLIPVLKRIHASSNVQRIIQNSPELSAMAAVRKCQCKWMNQATSNCFKDGLTELHLKDVTTRLKQAIHPLDCTANDAQQSKALLDAIDSALPQCEGHLPTAEGNVAPMKLSNKPASLALIPFLSPTAWIERADQAFLRFDSPDDDKAKRLRQQVMALWYEFFQEEVHDTPQQLVVKEMRLSASTHALKRLLSLTETGHQMLEADIVYEISLRQSPNVLLAISSPLTGFALAPGRVTFTDFGDLHNFKIDFVRFLDAYLRMFPESFSPNAFRRYVEHEKALLPQSDRTYAESARANVMAEFPAFAHHVGIEPSH